MNEKVTGETTATQFATAWIIHHEYRLQSDEFLAFFRPSFRIETLVGAGSQTLALLLLCEDFSSRGACEHTSGEDINHRNCRLPMQKSSAAYIAATLAMNGFACKHLCAHRDVAHDVCCINVSSRISMHTCHCIDDAIFHRTPKNKTPLMQQTKMPGVAGHFSIQDSRGKSCWKRIYKISPNSAHHLFDIR
ncbi:MAG TPA: hypothetical protein VL550_04430 [Rhodocyclaceae bacterium]|nr:hypothetical protein [Rhodocyclaceae bacterium]